MNIFIKNNWFKISILIITIIVILLFGISFLFSKYIDYKQLELSRKKLIQECIDKHGISINETGFYVANIKAKCAEEFSK